MEDLDRLLTSAGAFLRPELRTLRLSGPDRVRFLNGMVTNDVAKLIPGTGQLAIKTNARGRVEGLMRVRATEDAFLLDLVEAVSEKVRGTLDRYIIMDDCAIEDATGEREVVTVLGPAAEGPAIDFDGFVVEGPRTIVRDRSFGWPGYEHHLPRGEGAALLARVGAVERAAVEVLRVERGVPLDAVDLDEDTIPMEARLDAAISHSKGCYIGQEVIARATIQGQVNHLLVGLAIAGESLPPAGARLLHADREVGELSSVVRSPEHGVIALGYVHRKAEAPGTPIVVSAGDRSWPATVHGLPWRSPL